MNFSYVSFLSAYGEHVSHQHQDVVGHVPDPVQLAALVHRVLKDKVDPTDVKKLDRYVKDPRIVDAALTELDKELNLRKLWGERLPDPHAEDPQARRRRRGSS